MVEFKRTGDADYPRHLKIVNMANAKSGKTTFGATAPNVVTLATKNAGLMSVAHLNVPYMNITHSEELKQAIMILGSEALRTRAAGELGMPKIESIHLDLLDDVQQMLQKERLRAERRTQFQRDDWGWLLEQQREIMSSLMALPLNVIVSVHVKTTQDDESRMIYAPMLQGGFADELAGYPDFVVMSQRTREIDPQTGQPFTRFSLRVEGDLKNPHLGNRAAGRLPEVCEPSFQVLHDAVFKGIDTLVKHEPVQIQTGVTSPDGVAAPQEVAQNTGQPQQAQPTAAQTAQQAPQQTPAPAAAATPPPPSDENEPINEAGMKHLGNFYKEAGFNIPDWTGWTLGEARSTARMFVAVKGDIAEGRETWDTMVQFLQAIQTEKSFQVWAGKVGEEVPAAAPSGDQQTAAPASEEQPAQPVQTDVQNEAATPALAAEPVTPAEAATDVNASPEQPAGAQVSEQSTETAEAPAPADAPAGDRATTEAEAIATIQDQLGGVVVEDENTPCAICNGQINDIDIARLAKARFGKWACVDDYVALTKQ